MHKSGEWLCIYFLANRSGFMRSKNGDRKQEKTSFNIRKILLFNNLIVKTHLLFFGNSVEMAIQGYLIFVFKRDKPVQIVPLGARRLSLNVIGLSLRGFTQRLAGYEMPGPGVAGALRKLILALNAIVRWLFAVTRAVF
ncbi:hypothetical protein [Roseibium algae]|uniref:Uncharacterized protein n=1 Tax=Roseibium algae TaxID=3123038 RepID=A0ABU8THU6_9HYPH